MTQADQWTQQPIPMWEPASILSGGERKQREEERAFISSIPWASVTPKGDQTNIFENYRMFLDLDTGKYVRGLLTASSALSQAMADGYTRGILATNQAYDRFTANMIIGGIDFNKYEGTMLDFSDQDKAFLREEAAQSKWNITKIVDIPRGENVPIVEIWDESPADLFEREAPEGWNHKLALEKLQEVDSRLYNIFHTSLGGKENLLEITKDARNPYEFFYNLNHTMQINAIGHSLDIWAEQAGGLEQVYEKWGKNFFINGILNDPDMLGTTAASIALAQLTAGISLLGGGAIIGIKVSQFSKRIASLISASRKIAEATSKFNKTKKVLTASSLGFAKGMGHAARFTRTAQLYLPENIGPTLVRNHFFKGKYQAWSGLRRYGMNRVADTAEGLVTEPLAEIFNQKRQIGFGLRDEYDWGLVAIEGLVGAAISGPGHLNFLMGKAYQGLGYAGGATAVPFVKGYQKLSKGDTVSSLNNFVDRALKYRSSDYLLKSVRVIQKSEKITSLLREGIDPGNKLVDMEGQIGDPLYDELLNLQMTTMFEESQLTDEEFLALLEEALEETRQAESGPEGRWGELDPTDLTVLLSEKLVKLFEVNIGEDVNQSVAVARIKAMQEHNLMLYQKAAENNMSLKEYLTYIKETGNYFETLPGFLQPATKEAMGSDFATASEEAKFNKAKEVAHGIASKKMEELNTGAVNILEKEAEVDAIKDNLDLPDLPAKNTTVHDGPIERAYSVTNNIKETVSKIKKAKAGIKRDRDRASKDPLPQNKKHRTKIEKTEKIRDKKIDSLQKAMDSLEELSRDINTELNDWLDINSADGLSVELYAELQDLKTNVETSLMKLEDRGLRDIFEMTNNTAIFLAEINDLFSNKLTEDQKKDIREKKSTLEKILNKQRINTKDLSKKAIDALNNILKELDGRTSLAKQISAVISGEKKTLTINEVKTGVLRRGALIERIKLVINKKQTDLESSGEWEHHKREVERYNKSFREYRISLNKLFHSQTSKEMRVFDTVALIQESIAWQTEQKTILDAGDSTLKNMLQSAREDNVSTLTLNDWYKFLHPLSEFYQSRASAMEYMSEEEIKAELEKEYTIDEIERIVNREYKRTVDTIERYRPGLTKTNLLKIRSGHLKKTYIDQVSDDEIMYTDLTMDYILQQNEENVGKPLVEEGPETYSRTLEGDVAAWKEWVARLKDLARTEVGSDPRGVASWRIFRTMPEYFNPLGLGLHVIFSTAARDMAGNTIDINTAEGGVSIHKIRFNLDQVIEIADAWKSRGMSQLEGWQKQTIENILDALEKQAQSEGGPESGKNLFEAIAFISAVEAASKSFNEDMFLNRGYILSLHKHTGFPDVFIPRDLHPDPEINQREQDIRYKTAVRESAEQRINSHVSRNRKDYIISIANRFGIQADENNWKKVAMELPDIIVDRLHEVNEDLYVEGFGNGDIDWAPATLVGQALVDFLAKKEMLGNQPLTPVSRRTRVIQESIGDENSPNTGGMPVQVIVPNEGDLNMAMPNPIWELGTLINDYKFRNRVEYFINKEKFSKEELAALAEWKESASILEDVDPTGRELPFFVFPQFVGGHLRGQVINREQMKSIALELMLDIPRQASAFIHDQIRVSEGTPLKFKNDIIKVIKTDGTIVEVPAATYTEHVGHGDDFIIPFNRIGEILAIEAMSPVFDRMTETSLVAQERLREQFRATWAARQENAGKEWDILEAISSANDSDRNASGIYEQKLLSLANDITTKIEVDSKEYTVQELFQAIRDDVVENYFGTKDSDDFYLKAGSYAIGKILNSSVLEEMGRLKSEVFPMFHIFENKGDWAEGISLSKKADGADLKAKETLKNKYKIEHDSSTTAKLESVRELFKPPVMRRIYGGGIENFRLEFIKQNPTGEGFKALSNVSDAFGIEGGFTEQEVESFGQALFAFNTVELNSILVDEALGLGGDSGMKALRVMEVKKSDQRLLKQWQQTLNSLSIGEDVSPKVMAKEIKEKLGKLDTHEDLLDAKIDQWAVYEGTDRAGILRKYKEIDDARQYIKDLRDAGEELEVGSDNWETYVNKLIPEDKLLATDIGLFRAINIVNSNTFKLGIKRIEEAAKIFGFRDFDAKDFLGLDNLSLYQQFLPTAGSYRFYNSFAGWGTDPQGMSLERVAQVGDIEIDGVVYSDFKEFMKHRKKERGALYTEDDFQNDLEIFLKADSGADRMGMWGLSDEAFSRQEEGESDTDYRNRVSDELEQKLTRQEMIFWATQDKPPVNVFPDYTAEDTPHVMLKNIMENWFNTTEARNKTLQEEMELEARHWEKHGLKSTWLKIRSKARGLVNPAVAMASRGEFTYNPYYSKEHTNIDSNQRPMLIVNTGRAKGPLAMQPKTKERPFHNKGILALQRLHTKEKIDSIMSPIDNIREMADTEEHGMIAWDGEHSKGVELGWTPPWNLDKLPSPRPTLPDAINLGTDDAGRQAAKLYQDIQSWAVERGLDGQLNGTQVVSEVVPGLDIEAVRVEASKIEINKDNENEYVNKETNQVYRRVTELIRKGIEEETPLLNTASKIGTDIDLIIRDYFNGDLKAWDSPEYRGVFGDESLYNKLVEELKTLKHIFDIRKETVIATDLTVHSDEWGVAGTIDILTSDQENVIRIYDVKTKRSGLKNWTNEYDGQPSSAAVVQKQLSMYALLLKKKYGWETAEVGVIPFKVSYEPGDMATTEIEFIDHNIIDIKLLDGVKLTDGRTLSIEEAREGNPDLYPYFFIIMEMERARYELLRYSQAEELSPDEIMVHRNQWIEKLHSLTQLSRDIKYGGVKGRTLVDESMELAVITPDTTAEEWYTLLTSIASESNPHGYLSNPTLMHQTLKFGQVPSENAITSFVTSGGLNLLGTFDDKDLLLESSAKQSNDASKYWAMQLYTEHIGVVLKDYEIDGAFPFRKKVKNKDGVLQPIWKSPDLWVSHVVSTGVQIDVINRAKANLKKDSKSFIMDVTIEEHIYDNAENVVEYRAVFNQEVETSSRGSEEVTRVQKHPLGSIGFGALTRGDTNLAGKRAQLGISPEAALNMFALLENSRVIRKITFAKQMKKALGVTLTEEGVLKSVPIQDVLKDVFKYNQRHIREQNLLLSESLLRLTEGNLNTVVSKNNVGGREIRVVDLDNYTQSQEHMSSAWLESYISPVEKIVKSIDRAGFAETSEAVGLIRSYIEGVRTGEEKLDKAVVMHLAILLQAPEHRNTNEGIVQSLFDMDEFGGVYSRSSQIAASLHRELTLLNSEDKFLRETPWYHNAREFFFRNMGGDDPVANWIKYLKDQNLWEKSDEYIIKDMRYHNQESFDIEEAREVWAIRAYLTAAGTELNHSELEVSLQFQGMRDESIADLDMNIIKDSRTSDDMIKLSQKLEDFRIRDINSNINEWASRKFINEEQARLIRAVVLRAYRLNPEILQNLSFSVDHRIKGVAEASKEGGKYFIRFGGELKRMGTDSLDVVQVVAHELAHVGRLKFIEDNGGEWAKYDVLMSSDPGKSLMRKLVMSWHNGHWTTAAQQEYESYISDTEEFIAALGQFHLMKDLHGEVGVDLEASEAALLDHSNNILERIFQYVKTIFSRINSVWSNFHQQYPGLESEVNRLADQIFGWDPNEKSKLATQESNSDQRLNWMHRFDQPEERTYAMEDIEYTEVIRRRDKLNTKFKNKEASEAEVLELGELNARIFEDDNDSYSWAGVSRQDVFRRKPYLNEHYSKTTQYGKKLNVEKMLQDIGENTQRISSSTDMAVMMHLISKEMEAVIGQAIHRGAGQFATQIAGFASKGLAKVGLAKDKDSIRNAAIATIVGRTGVESTWNSGHHVPIMLSQVLNDQIVTVSGQYTNAAGTPSVERVLTELSIFHERITAFRNTIEEEIHPILTKLRGKGNLTDAQGLKYMNEIDVEIALLSEAMGRGEIYEFSFSAETQSKFDSMSDKKRKTILDAMKGISKTFHDHMKKHNKDGKELGVYGGDFNTTLPYKFNKNLMDPVKRKTLVEELGELISNRIINEGPDGKIDPVTFFGAGFVPRTDNINEAIDELKFLEEKKPEYFDWLVTKIVISNDPKLRDNNAKLMKRKKSLISRLESADTRVSAVDELRSGVRFIYQEMSRGNITWIQLGKIKEKGSMYNAYLDTVKLDTENTRYGNSLFGPGRKSYIPSYIAYNPNENEVTLVRDIAKGTATSIHVHNIVNRAGNSQYVPNDSWVVPTLADAIGNHNISEHLILNPKAISEDFRKGMADEIGEKKMLAETFGMYGTYKDLLNLFGAVVRNSPRGLRDYSGEALGQKDIESLVDSSVVLQEKHDFVRGIVRRAHNETNFEKFMFNIAPSMTKIAFGGNLALATATVEGMMNVLQEGIGKGNLAAVFRGVFNPILALKENQREEVLNDLTSIVGALTQGHIPDYEKPASHTERGRIEQFGKFWGDTNLRLAKSIMRNIAATRAMSMRSFIKKNIDNGRLQDLVDIIEKEPLKTPDDLKDRMRKAGFNMGGINAHEMTISYLLRAGLLDPGKFTLMLSMVPSEGPRYSPFQMYSELSSTMESTSKEFDARLGIITSLKMIEKQYIEEVVVMPNAFDIYTGGDPLSAVWEVFRRYPVLFASQHLFRKASRLSFVRYGFGLVSMMVLDTLYMMLLRVGNGARVEDVIKDWERDPWKTSVGYFTRLPILGRWGGLVGEAFNSWTKGVGNTPGAFIPGAALITAMTGAEKAISSQWNDKPTKMQDTINALRVVPVFGDTLMRLGIYTGFGERIARRNYRGRSRSEKTDPAGNYGLRFSDAGFGWEGQMGGLINELTQEEPRSWNMLENREQIDGIPMSNIPSFSKEQHQDRLQDIGQPVGDSKGKDVISALENQKPAQAPSGLLKEN